MATSDTRAITPRAILSFPHLHAPQAGPQGGEPKYSATLIFPAGTDLAALKAAAVAAGEAKWPGKFTDMVRKGQVKLPFRTDWEAKNYPANSTFINVRSKQQPGVVGQFGGADGKPVAIPVDKIRAELYAGAFVRASVAAFGYDTSGNKGVSFGLNNLQKMGEGERIDGRQAAENEFDADLSAPPADISGLI